MADVTIQCEKCGKETTVSEYVSPETVVCGACGTKLVMPEITPARAKPAPILRQTELPQTTPAVLTDKEKSAVRAQYKRGRRYRRESRTGISPSFKSWLLFFVLAGGLYYARHYGLPPGGNLDAFIVGGIAATGIAHLAVVAVAFKDDFFQGTLCLLIPFYSIYYIFAASDAFYLRAVVAALVIAFGPDTALFLQEQAMKVYLGVKNWLDTASIAD